ncbi:hypothetical protein WBK31_35620 [Nonomuraea sp. N2-4H]|uniref:hypothetical protein n=1 Tax=Nonomuraea sp. N2-4H TaxID=3128898 RepID=UPI003246E0CE
MRPRRRRRPGSSTRTRPGEPYRGLVFHDEAWHWAMLGIYGERYWVAHPELADPPPEYRALG